MKIIDWSHIGSVPNQLARLKRQVEAMWAPDDPYAGIVTVRIEEKNQETWSPLWWLLR